jgi:hypothetical protein
MTVQTIYAGAAATLPLAAAFAPAAVSPLLWTLFATAALHLLLVAGEVSLPHPTAHARLAVYEMVRGRYRKSFQLGGVGSAVVLLGPFFVGLGSSWVWAISIVAVLGLLAYEHAYVQAGQSVPLA